MRYHYVYKVKNKINGKYYIGVHSTEKLDDGYLGSGTAIKNAIAKYGIENFEKEIIEFLESAEEKWLAETRYVTLDVVQDKNSYNMAPGGKNWIAAMKREGDPRLKEHQSKAGKIGSKAFMKSLSLEQKKRWHSAGGKVASKKTFENKTGLFSAAAKEKQKKSVSEATKGTIELWHPSAPKEVTNRNSSGYKSGWSVRVKPNSEKFHEYVNLGYIQRDNMNFLKFKTATACLLAAAAIAGACEEETEQLGPPQPVIGGAGGQGEDAGQENSGGEGGALIDGEVPTCLEGD